MKGIFVILDGVADLPVPELGQKTPLEVAKTPNLDYLASKSKLDYCYTVKEGVAPQSSNAVISLFGQDPNSAARGSLEAMGSGISLKNGDLALRTNFATIDNLEDRNIIDSRAGRTLSTKEARILSNALNTQIKLHYPFKFFPTVGHRGVLVFKGGFSDHITNPDPNYKRGIALANPKKKLLNSIPLDDEENSQLSADLVNTFIRKSFEVLDKHPINIKRAKKGLHAANIIICRDAGDKPVKYKKLKGKWAAIAYMPLEIGIARALQMDVLRFKGPKLKNNDIYGHLFATLNGFIKYSVKALKKNKNKYDYFYIHFKKTDTPGHDNKPLEKVKMIELLDAKFFSFLKNFIKDNKLIVTADHTTSCALKTHTADPVPVLTYPYHKHQNQRFIEQDGLKGKRILGRNLLESNLF